MYTNNVDELCIYQGEGLFDQKLKAGDNVYNLKPCKQDRVRVLWEPVREEAWR